MTYQVQSRLGGIGEWLDDHLPFTSLIEANEYIKTQPRCFEYRIIEEEEFPEMGTAEYFDLMDCWDAIGGDWEG